MVPRITQFGSTGSLGVSRRSWPVLYVVLALLLQQAGMSSAQGQSDTSPLPWRGCNSDLQLVNCGEIPLTKAYRQQRRACCRRHRPGQIPQTAQAVATAASVQQAAVADQITRTDLTTDYLTKPNYYIGQTGCPQPSVANVPTFSVDGSGGYTNVAISSSTVPALTKAIVKKVKNYIMSGTSLPLAVRNYYTNVRRVNTVNGVSFNHPGTLAGPAELALLRYRVNNNFPVQSAARDSLVTGTGVKPKTYVTSSGTWSPPTDCQPTGYYGPLAMQSVQIRYGGSNAPGIVCPANYPAAAPQDLCGHVSFVELDGQMAYKMALAFHATGDTRYSDKVLSIASSWSSSNTKWGYAWENGPLEAGWGIAAMSRALELVRNRAPPGLIQQFTTWVMGPPVKDNIVYNMEYYINLSKTQNRPNIYGNWHTTLAEAYMAVGVLSDNITTYNRGVDLFSVTLSDYLKWGKGAYAAGRVLGECSETLRDMYHAQFGLGGLVQAAEIAWQQDDPTLYAQGNYALASMMELLARFSNAYLSSKSTAMLPQNFVYYDSSKFPTPPPNCTWKFNIETQLWSAYWTANGSYAGIDLQDGKKYLLGFGFLPTGWEVGYNHYAGRLGLPMPETAALLSRVWPEWQEFHWGLGTLSHAQSAQQLWRNGLTQANLCSSTALRAATASNPVVTEAAGVNKGNTAASVSPTVSAASVPQATDSSSTGTNVLGPQAAGVTDGSTVSGSSSPAATPTASAASVPQATGSSSSGSGTLATPAAGSTDPIAGGDSNSTGVVPAAAATSTPGPVNTTNSTTVVGSSDTSNTTPVGTDNSAAVTDHSNLNGTAAAVNVPEATNSSSVAGSNSSDTVTP